MQSASDYIDQRRRQEWAQAIAPRNPAQSPPPPMEPIPEEAEDKKPKPNSDKASRAPQAISPEDHAALLDMLQAE